MKTFIYPHLEMGDNIICNGLIREICSKNPNTHHFLATKKLNIESIRFMYRDLKNLTTEQIIGTYDIPNVLKRLDCDSFLKIGHGLIRLDKHFDEGFYNQHNFSINTRWDSFHVQRDRQREQNFFDRFNIDSDYIFLHEDPSRNMIINKDLNPDLRVIKAERHLTDNIFDYLKLIENAKEIHCIPSSFLFLCDSFDFDNRKVMHKYSRYYPYHAAPTLKLQWEELT